MSVVLAGGSGQVGALPARTFSGRGDEVVVLSRRPRRLLEPGAWLLRTGIVSELPDAELDRR